MNENLQKTIDEILNKSILIAEQTGSFLNKEIPLVVQEFLNWGIVSNILLLTLGISLFLLGRFTPYLWLSKTYEEGNYTSKFFNLYSNETYNYYGSPSDLVTSWIIFGIFSLASIIMICISLYHIFKIIYAPRLYLLEYIGNTIM